MLPGQLCGEGGSAITSNMRCKAETLPGKVIAEGSVPRGKVEEGSFLSKSGTVKLITVSLLMRTQLKVFHMD